MFVFSCGTERDHWSILLKVFFVSLSARIDWDEFPGLTITLGIFSYLLGISMMKNEHQTA